MRSAFFPLLFALTLGTAAAGQVAAVKIRLQDGNSLVGKSWFFAYSCDVGLKDNPGLAVHHSWQSHDLRLVVDGKERLVPEKALASLRFDWESPRPGWLDRSKARFLLSSGETIEQWNLHTAECGQSTVELDLVLPPEGARKGKDWWRIDLWATSSGEASAYSREKRVVEVHFNWAATR